MKRIIFLLLLCYSLTSCKSEPRKMADDLMKKIDNGSLKLEFEVYNGIPVFGFSDLLWGQQYYEKNEDLPLSKEMLTYWFTLPEGITKYEFLEEKESIDTYETVTHYRPSDYKGFESSYKTYDNYVKSTRELFCKDGCRDIPEKMAIFYKTKYPTYRVTYIAYNALEKLRIDMVFVKQVGWECGMIGVAKI